MIDILIGLGAGAAGVGAGYLIAKKINDANYNIFLEQAKAKAKAIEFEAERTLKDAKIQVQEAEFEAKKKYDDKTLKLQKEYTQKFEEIGKKEQTLLNEQEILNESRAELEKSRNEAKSVYEEGIGLKTSYQAKLQEALKVLEHAAGLTQEEAREEVLKKVE